MIIITLSVLLPIMIIFPFAYILFEGNGKVSRMFQIWLSFTVVIALMPIIFNGILITFFVQPKPPISGILVNGELFIVSVAIGSDAIGRVLANKSSHRIFGIAPLAGCFVLVLISSLLFAIFAAPIESNLRKENVPSVSFVLFMITVLLSEICVLQSEV